MLVLGEGSATMCTAVWSKPKWRGCAGPGAALALRIPIWNGRGLAVGDGDDVGAWRGVGDDVHGGVVEAEVARLRRPGRGLGLAHSDLERAGVSGGRR